jgi:hypothetical protein
MEIKISRERMERLMKTSFGEEGVSYIRLGKSEGG